MASPDHYAVLRVPPAAPREAIRRAYLLLAKESHPDIAGDAGHDRMQRINAAWAVLGDPDQRAAYDRTLPRSRFQDGGGGTSRPGAARPAQPPRPKNWRSVGVPWEERHADWYAYFELAPDADEDTIRLAIARRRQNAVAGGDQPWAVRMRAELDRIEALLLDPIRRKQYDDELARVRARGEELAARRRAAAEGQFSRRAVYNGDPGIDWYAVIGVHSGTSAAGIRAAFEKKGRELSKAKITAAAYARERQRLIEASRILTDPAMRAAYDAVRAGARR